MGKESKNLVDYVENQLFQYLKTEKLCPGSMIPGELQLAKQFGVGRSVVREALSRLRMLGLVKSRTRKGIILTEPDIVSVMQRMITPQILGKDNILDLLGLRVSLEIGMADFIIDNATATDIAQLEKNIQQQEIQSPNQLTIESDHLFHTQLYRISGNHTLLKFQEMLYPLLVFIKQNYQEYITCYNHQVPPENLITHAMILESIKQKNASVFRDLMKKHLNLYIELIREERNTNPHSSNLSDK